MFGAPSAAATTSSSSSAKQLDDSSDESSEEDTKTPAPPEPQDSDDESDDPDQDERHGAHRLLLLSVKKLLPVAVAKVLLPRHSPPWLSNSRATRLDASGLIVCMGAVSEASCQRCLNDIDARLASRKQRGRQGQARLRQSADGNTEMIRLPPTASKAADELLSEVFSGPMAAYLDQHYLASYGCRIDGVVRRPSAPREALHCSRYPDEDEESSMIAAAMAAMAAAAARGVQTAGKGTGKRVGRGSSRALLKTSPPASPTQPTDGSSQAAASSTRTPARTPAGGPHSPNRERRGPPAPPPLSKSPSIASRRDVTTGLGSPQPPARAMTPRRSVDGEALVDAEPAATPLELLIALHPATRPLGPLVVLPRTHTRKFHAWRFGFPKRLRALLLRRRRAYLLNVPAGSAVLLNARVWRAWEANTTSDQRLAVMRITLTPPEPVYDSDEEEGERRSRLANTLAATRDRLPQPARREPLRAAIARCVEAWRRQVGEEGILNEWEDDSDDERQARAGKSGGSPSRIARTLSIWGRRSSFYSTTPSPIGERFRRAAERSTQVARFAISSPERTSPSGPASPPRRIVSRV